MISEMKNGSPEIKECNALPAETPLRDMARALRITGGDAALADQMFEQMVQDIPTQFEMFRRLQREENWRELKRCVHRLRGSVTYCAVPALEHGLSTLETAAAAGNSEDIGTQVQALESIVERLVASIHQDAG